MIIELFSKRQKRLRGDVPDVYAYDVLPNPLRVQAIQIIQESVGEDRSIGNRRRQFFEDIHKVLCHELGRFRLTDGIDRTAEWHVFNFFLNEPKIDLALDVVELCMSVLEYKSQNDHDFYFHMLRSIEPKAAIEALNYRFKEHGVGYQYEGGKIIRVDATFIHSELVKPVISLLANRRFSGAQDEFLRAHECYRHGEHKTCVNECLKAFESTLKTICKEMNWLIDPDAPAKKLIEACLTNELIPSYLQDQYTQLRQLLTSGVPTLRNKESGHGQGSEIKEVPDYLASYALNLTATSIMFLVKAYEAKA